MRESVYETRSLNVIKDTDLLQVWIHLYRRHAQERLDKEPAPHQLRHARGK